MCRRIRPGRWENVSQRYRGRLTHSDRFGGGPWRHFIPCPFALRGHPIKHKGIPKYCRPNTLNDPLAQQKDGKEDRHYKCSDYVARKNIRGDSCIVMYGSCASQTGSEDRAYPKHVILNHCTVNCRIKSRAGRPSGMFES